MLSETICNVYKLLVAFQLLMEIVIDVSACHKAVIIHHQEIMMTARNALAVQLLQSMVAYVFHKKSVRESSHLSRKKIQIQD